MNKLQYIADDLLTAGFSILPVRDNKKPAISEWTYLQKNLLTSEVAEGMFLSAWGVATICGKVSGGLECIDFDAHEKDIDSIWIEFSSDPGVDDIINRNQLYM